MTSSGCERHSDCVEIEEISSATSNTVNKVSDEDASSTFPAAGRLKMHRSAVRPFFCCGSELSLISINEQQELKPFDKQSFRENGANSGDSNRVCCESLLTDIQNDVLVCEECNVNRDKMQRKKNLEGFPRKMSRKSWAVKLRGKLPKRLQNVDEHGNYTGSSSGVEAGCMCTTYNRTDGQTPLYDCQGPSAAKFDEASGLTASVCNGAECEKLGKTKSGKGKGRGKYKSSHLNQVEISASGSLKAWVEEKPDGETNSHTMSLEKDQNRQDSSSEAKNVFASNRCSGLFAPVFHKQSVISWPNGAAANQNDTDIENAEDYGEDESQYSDVLSLGSRAPYVSVHSQVDYVHCLVPDLACIANCGFYWGVMDRYEAERLLENKPEGTFLLRDSAQDEFLFSVSFRRYGRSLHARVEQYNHKFSFDSHDPGVFATNTVCGLIEHYKDPTCCMFFEPMLTLPLNRSFPFSLQHLCRSTIVSSTSYDGILSLPLPNSLQNYLRYYHYKQKVRVRNLDQSGQSM